MVIDTTTLGKLNNIRFVDGVKFTTVQAAVDDLGSNPGLVVIPSTYAGAEPTTVGNGIELLDLRKSVTLIGNASGYNANSLFQAYNGSGTTNRIFGLASQAHATAGGTGALASFRDVLILFVGALENGQDPEFLGAGILRIPTAHCIDALSLRPAPKTREAQTKAGR